MGSLWVPELVVHSGDCGIAGLCLSGMIVGRAVRLLYLIFRQVLAGLWPAAHTRKMRKSSCCATRSRYCAAR
jgi:hypothetical protein